MIVSYDSRVHICHCDKDDTALRMQLGHNDRPVKTSASNELRIKNLHQLTPVDPVIKPGD